MAEKKKQSEIELAIKDVSSRRIQARVVGLQPLICNALNGHARRELLFPSLKKNATEKATTMKHDPMAEYRRSPYRSTGNTAPTRILMPSTAFKKAIAGVATDLPGAAKAQIGRLMWIEGDTVSVYGVPKMLMAMVKVGTFPGKPDVRTRAILPEWCCEFWISFVHPVVKEGVIATLLSAAGIMRGVGDWRVEKGSGSYGQFETVDKSNKEWARIKRTGGRQAQDKALDQPEYYDRDTRELYEWFVSESARREMKVAG
jgi:hypothetical protein